MGRNADRALAKSRTDRTKNRPELAGTALYALAWVIFLTACFAGLEPLLLVAFMMIFVSLCTLYLILAGKFASLYKGAGPLFVTMLAFAGYVLLSSFWSAYPLLAVKKALLILLITFGVRFFLLLAEQMSPLQSHRCARGIIIGLLIGATFLAIEYATGHFFLNSFSQLFPGLIQTAPGVKHIPAYHLNANASVIILLLWSALLAARAWKSRPLRYLFVTALLGISLFILYKTQSATAQLAFIFATLAWLGARFAPRALNLIVGSLWVVAVVGAVPIIMAVHYAGLQNLTQLPYSFRDRIHIWNHTAKLVPKNPVLGIGIRSNRSYKEKPRHEIPGSKQKKLVDHQGWHAHNMFLQTWYELGAVGAAFLLAIGLLMLRVIEKIDRPKRPFAYALFVSFCVIAALGYGMWQSWLLATYGWSVVFLLIGLKYASENGSGQGSSAFPGTE